MAVIVVVKMKGLLVVVSLVEINNVKVTVLVAVINVVNMPG